MKQERLSKVVNSINNSVEHTREWFASNRSKFAYKLELSCANCGGVSEHLHHIVPLIKGGTNNDSNIIQLCNKCHGLVHDRDWTNHKKATKEGLERAKANGKQLGRVDGSKFETKKAKDNKAKIIKLSKSFNGTLKDTEVLELLNIDRGTYYRYKKQMKAELSEKE